MTGNTNNPLQRTVGWLATHGGFPTHRLPSQAELLLCISALAQAEEAASAGGFHIQRRDGAKDAALRAHALRRSQVHFKCDNSAKV